MFGACVYVCGCACLRRSVFLRDHVCLREPSNKTSLSSATHLAGRSSGGEYWDMIFALMRQMQRCCDVSGSLVSRFGVQVGRCS